jgi:hypothetical protein
VWDVVVFRLPLQMNQNRKAKIADPMTFGYRIDATLGMKIQVAKLNICSHAKGSADSIAIGRRHPWLGKSPEGDPL